MKLGSWCNTSAAPATVIGSGRTGCLLSQPLRNAREGVRTGMLTHPTVSPETGLPPAIVANAVGFRAGFCHGRCMIPAFSDPLIAANATCFLCGKARGGAVPAPYRCRREFAQEWSGMNVFFRRSVGAGLVLTGMAWASAWASESLSPVDITASALNAAEVTPESSVTQVRVIEREEFAGRITSLADTLSESGHVQIRRTGGLGSASTLSIRGATSQQVQVLLDGMLLNDPVSGYADISRVSLHDIGRIQIYPGGAPARYAHAGIGGVLVLETRDAGDDTGTDITLGGGSFDTRRAALSTQLRHGRWQHAFALNHQASDNDFRYRNQAPWFNPNDGRYTRRRNAYVDQYEASLKSGLFIDAHRQLHSLLQWQDSEQGVPTIQNWAANDTALSTDARRLQLSYRDSSWAAGTVHSQHRLLWAMTNEQYGNRGGHVGTGSQDTRTHTQQIGMAHTLSWLLGPHTLSAALDLSHYDYQQRDVLGTRQRDTRQRLQTSSALSHEWHSDTGRWATQTVLRHFMTGDDSDEVGNTGTLTRTQQHADYTGWQLALTRHVGHHWQWQGSVARQVRIPSLREQYGQEGLLVGNPDLNAEEALNLDLTLRTDQRWGHFEITGYYRDLSPSMVALYDSRGVGRYTNLEARVAGAETTLHLTPTDHWQLTLSATAQDSENRSDAVQYSQDKKLPGIYHHALLVRSRWQIASFHASVSWHQEGELYYDAANLLEADTRRQLNARLGWEGVLVGTQRSRLTLDLRNLTDTQYQDFTRFPGPGRSWLLAFTHHFE